MSSSTGNYKFLETFACAHVSDGFMENDGDRMLGSFMKKQGSLLTEVRELKETGNGLFRQNEFDMAAACYDEACKLLSLSLGNTGREDIHSLSDLVVSLLSNMPACALKLEGYRAASGMCSMILDTFPRNVKALFRRAVASIKLKRFSKAELDLVEALTVEPSNKDVLRELEVVRSHLLIKENGKRVLEVDVKDCVEGNNKKHINVSSSDMGIKDSESVITEVMEDQSDVSMKDNESVNMEETEFQSIYAKKSVFEFTKKGCGSSCRRIPAQSYKKMLEGKKMSFYRQRDLTTLTVRIIKSEASKGRDTIKERRKKKKKKKRRCHKKWKAKTMGAMNEDMTPSDVINVKPAISSVSLSAYTGGMISSTSSTCDNASPPDTHIYQDYSMGVASNPSFPICHVNEEDSSFWHPPQIESNNYEPFIFSARHKKCKTYSFEKPSGAQSTPMLCRYSPPYHVREKWRMANIKKNHSQGDESPRHILSTSTRSRSPSYKFLRPRGVSVSCRRYSSEAQFMKKRKGMLAQVATDHPVKKPCLVVNPMCSLFSIPKNVLIISDSESRVSSAGTA